jgi:hypothetical protein
VPPHGRADPAPCSFPPAVLRREGSFFISLYQLNIEKPSKDRAALGQEIRKSVAELFDAALESRVAIAIKGAPDQHAEGQYGPRSSQDGSDDGR